jgi:hypothetical protein
MTTTVAVITILAARPYQKKSSGDMKCYARSFGRCRARRCNPWHHDAPWMRGVKPAPGDRKVLLAYFRLRLTATGGPPLIV